MRAVYSLSFDPRLRPLSLPTWRALEATLREPNRVLEQWTQPEGVFVEDGPAEGYYTTIGDVAVVFELGMYPAFVGASLERIREPLSADCEFLPVTGLSESVELLHIVRTVDCIDRSLSPAVTGVVEPKAGAALRDYVFVSGSVRDEYCFRTPDMEGGYFYTRRFIDLMRRAGVRGLRFKEEGIA